MSLSADTLRFVSSGVTRLVDFFGVSRPRRILASALYVLVIYPALPAFYEVAKAVNVTQKREAMARDEGAKAVAGYDATVRALDNCERAEQSRDKREELYCNEAILYYRKSMQEHEQPRVNHLSAERAYSSMRNDILHRKELLQLDLPPKRDQSKLEYAAQLAFTNLGLALMMISLVGAYIAMTIRWHVKSADFPELEN